MSKRLWWGIIIMLVLVFVWLFKMDYYRPQASDFDHESGYYGVTFSKKMATELKLDWKQLYIVMLDDLRVKKVRLPIYWDDIEKNRGELDLTDYEFMLDEGGKRGVEFIIPIGYRLPRWPECHIPTWANDLETEEFQKETLAMMETLVKHYKYRPEIVMWQVENEPLLGSFGICPPVDKEFLAEEVALVKALDNRKILITGSGELSSWKTEASLGDVFGTTMYRIVWGPATGFFHYPLPASFYQWKAKRANLEPGSRIIAELQAEPWAPKSSLADIDKKTADKSFSAPQFQDNIAYAKSVDFDEVYLWGVEWWYFKYKAGETVYWDMARKLFP